METKQYRHSPNSFQIGREYEEFIYQYFWESRGFDICPIRERQGQYTIGENRLGMEIKHDRGLSNSEGIFIETAEKSDAANIHYVPSGIYRGDNTWLYAVGDYDIMYVFFVEHLRKIDQIKPSPEYIYRPTAGDTFEGFCLRKYKAETLAGLIINF